MKLRRGIFIYLILVAAVVASGGAILLAADSDARYDLNRDGMISAQEAKSGVRDYFAGEIGQDAAVDLMLRSFAGVPVAAPRPTPQPTPIPMPTATPKPTEGMLDCDIRSSGRVNDAAYTVNTRVSRHMEVTFINPDHPEWTYGVLVREKYQSPTAQFYVKHTGEYGLLSVKGDGEYGFVSYGTLPRLGIPFNTGVGERNQITMLAQSSGINNHRHEFYVNGERVTSVPSASRMFPIDYERFRSKRQYWIWGWAPGMNRVSGYTIGYEGLCIQDEWTYQEAPR